VKILVTGGAGYIGSQTCKSLAEAGHNPIVYDNLRNSSQKSIRWGPFERGDITDSERLQQVMAEHRPDAVIHFAALASVGESHRIPVEYYRTNVVGTICLLQAMKSADLNRLIVSSSSTVYGIPEHLPIPETASIEPISPYGRSKAVMEQMLSDSEKAYGLDWLALRYFNAAGADLEIGLGDRNTTGERLIPNVLSNGLENDSIVTVNGDNFPTPDGTCVRDYVHVKDVADAHLVALDNFDLFSSRIYNIGNDRGYSVLEVIMAVEKVISKKIDYKFGCQRPGDVPQLISDSTAFRDSTPWCPVHSDLETIIYDSWQWEIGLNKT